MDTTGSIDFAIDRDGLDLDSGRPDTHRITATLRQDSASPGYAAFTYVDGVLTEIMVVGGGDSSRTTQVARYRRHEEPARWLAAGGHVPRWLAVIAREVTAFHNQAMIAAAAAAIDSGSEGNRGLQVAHRLASQHLLVGILSAGQPNAAAPGADQDHDAAHGITRPIAVSPTPDTPPRDS